MRFNLDTCRWVIWGLANDPCNTYHHIQFALNRTLKHLGKDVTWYSEDDDVSRIDFSNTCFVSVDIASRNLPRRDDCFYAIHNMDNPKYVSRFDGLKTLRFGSHQTTNVYDSEWQELENQTTFFHPGKRSVEMRWASDLVPSEIEANKPVKVWNQDSKIVNYVGSYDANKSEDIQNFIRACKENDIEFRNYGGYNNGEIVSLEKHISLVKESYLAPAFQGKDQIALGYASCRLFKNISYGQMPLTPSRYVNELFDNKLIFNEDCYQLFYDGRERLQNMPLSELHSLMDHVAKNHTYVSRLNSIMTAIKVLEN